MNLSLGFPEPPQNLVKQAAAPVPREPKPNERERKCNIADLCIKVLLQNDIKLLVLEMIDIFNRFSVFEL